MTGNGGEIMGKKIAFVGAGAVGGYTGAHGAGRRGRDLHRSWPAHVEHMRKHGLRVTHAMKEAELPGAGACTRRLTNARQLRQGKAGRHRFCLHEVLQHRLGGDADPAISGAGRFRGLAAELHERGNDCRRRRLGQDTRLHRLEHHGQSAGARCSVAAPQSTARRIPCFAPARCTAASRSTPEGFCACSVRRQRQGDE